MWKGGRALRKGSFIDDKEKMKDFVELTKDEFLASYSYLSEEEYNLTKKDYIENKFKKLVKGGNVYDAR
jgi:hypothetical protein